MHDQFFEEWQIYAKLLTHDYMDHRAFFDRLRTEILTRFKRPIAILDLGCGDLTPVLPLLKSIPVEHYTGIDESEAALALAENHLAPLGTPYRLVKGDLLESMLQIEERFDVILASFSLHHLADTADKQHALEAGGRLLRSGGIFAVVDIFRAELETREGYLERWVAHAETRYTELGKAELKSLSDHVRARDFPVSLSTFEAIGKQAGLNRFDVLLTDQARLNCLVRFCCR